MLHRPAVRFPSPALFLLIAALLALPACSTLGRTTGEDEEPEPPRPPREEPTEPRREEPAGPRTVRGYRIQILKTDDKTAADQRAAEAESVWSQPVEVNWQAPYYSVRVGAFGSRQSAQGTLRAVQERYPDAFLVPDTVTIYPD